ncbi:MAG: hypothetical protein ACREBT_01395 [Thermoplasmata archaeon]
MDVPLYAIALAVFGVLYLVFGIFLVFVLIIALVVIYLYLVLRYGTLPDEYPYGAADSLITAIFVGVTWGVFTFLGPKNPIPFVGTSLTYESATIIPLAAILAITLVLVMVFLLIGAFVLPRWGDRARVGGQGGSDGQQTVGSG